MASLLSLIESMTVHQCQQMQELLDNQRLDLFQQLLKAARLGTACEDAAM
jgi:hypothetical protein